MTLQTKERTERGDRISGNYKIETDWYKGTISLVPTNYPYLFKSLYDRDLSRKANVLVYIDKKALSSLDDSTRYLAYTLDKDPYFQVRVTTNPDASLVEYSDVVLVRFDPPINEDFLQELEKYDNEDKLFINPPRAQRYFSNKKYLEDIAREYPKILPKTKLVSKSSELKAALRYFSENGIKELVYKPVDEFGGNGIGKFDTDGEEYSEVLFHLNHYFLGNGSEFILQEYIDGIYGDKRVHVINGEPVGAVLRTPAEGEFRCNVKKGGSLVRTNIAPEDYIIIDKINTLLQEYDVYWTGIDILKARHGNSERVYLGEINAVSPGCVVGTDKINGNYYGEGVAFEIVEDIKTKMQMKSLALA